MKHFEFSEGNKLKRKRLLMGVTLSEVGGCQKVVYDIITNLPDTEYEITLVTSPSGELLDWIKDFNVQRSCKIKVIELKSLKRDISIWNDIKTLFDLLRILYKGRYDIAHFHSSKMGILGRVAAKLARVSQIYYTVHGWGLHALGSGMKFKIFSMLEKMAGTFTTKVVCVSMHDLHEGLLNGWIRKEKACVIHNGIALNTGVKYDLKRELLIPEETPVIAAVERLSEPKDPLFTIRVAEYVKRAGKSFKLLIIGDGVMRKDCQELIESLKLKEQVLLMGTCNNVREMLQSVDISLLFSKWEGLPISIIEAMFAGKPVIASNVGGIPELIIHGQSGYLIDGSNITQAAEYIIRLLNDDLLREKLGSEGKRIALEKFTLDEMVRKYRILYSEA